MKNFHWFLIATLAIVLIWYVITKRFQQSEALRRAAALKADQLQVTLSKVYELMNRSNSWEVVQLQIQSQVKDLAAQLVDAHPKIADELRSAAAVIGVKEDTKALHSLSKIIEIQLYNLNKNDAEMSRMTKGKKPCFALLIKSAKKKGLLKPHEFYWANALRLVRNEEAHEAGVNKDRITILNLYAVAFQLITKLCPNIENNLTPALSV